jgi:predicted small lipoprotein YifL
MRVSVWSVLALLVVLMAGIAGCGTQAPRSLPPDTAPSKEVLVAYLQALVAGDCATARALSTPENVANNGVWCDRPRVTSFGSTGDGAGPTDNEIVYAVSITTVGGDLSLPDAERLWFYDLRRQPNGAWRVYGSGSGP